MQYEDGEQECVQMVLRDMLDRIHEETFEKEV